MRMKNQLTAIRRALPSLASEENGAPGKAFVLRVTLWSCLLLIALMSILQVLYHPEYKVAQLLLIPCLFLVSAALVLLQRGHLRVVSWIVVSVGWLVFSVDLFLMGGIQGTSVIGQVLIMVLAGFLFGGKTALVLALLTAGADYLVLQAEIQGWVQNLQPLGVNPTRWIVQTGYIFISGLFIWLTDRRIQSALGLAKNNADRYRALFERTSDAIFILNAQHEIITINQQAADLLGYSLDELVGESVRTVISPEHHTEHLTRLERIRQQAGPPIYEEALIAKDGHQIPVEMNIARVEDNHGRFLHIQSIVRDISARKALEAQLRRQAFYDSLTALPNRALFENRLSQAVARAKRGQTTLAVLFLDFDKFKQVNDRYGHQTGDRTLQKLAARMQASVRESDTVARLGGDEFVMLVENLTSPEAANQIAAKIHDNLSRPFSIDQITISLTASIGISLYIPSGFTPADLIRQADQAMYQAKTDGENGIVLYSEEMSGAA